MSLAISTQDNIARVAGLILELGDGADERFTRPQDINFIERWEIQQGRIAAQWIEKYGWQVAYQPTEKEIQAAQDRVKDCRTSWEAWEIFANA